MNYLPEIGDVVRFGKRRGYVVGYSTLKRRSQSETYQTYVVVELDPESRAYLQPHDDEPVDCFVSLMLVYPDSIDFVNEREL